MHILKKHLHFVASMLAGSLSISLAACHERTGTLPGESAEVELQLDMSTSGFTGPVAQAALDDAAALIVSISDAMGTLIYDAEEVALYDFDGTYLSHPLSLVPGAYALTELIVVDANGNALYAAPREGSLLAHLVDDPLPIPFNAGKDAVTTIRPQVLSVNEQTPEDFGYASFGFEVIRVIDFLIAAFAYDDSLQTLRLTDAEIDISTEDGELLYSGNLGAVTNHLKVTDDHASYRVIVSKPGYETHEEVFSRDDLAAHFSSDELGPITIVLQRAPVAVPTCVHPTPAMLAATPQKSIFDIQFDRDCRAYLATTISGRDYVYVVNSAGQITTLQGSGNANIGAISVHPDSGQIAVGYSVSPRAFGIKSGSSLPVVATSPAFRGTNWQSYSYLNDTPSSIATDHSGCTWMPNWTIRGRLVCIQPGGNATVVADMPGHIEAVGLDPDDMPYVSIGATIYRVDRVTGSFEAYHTASAVVLDLAFDSNGDLYFETQANEIRVLSTGTTTSQVFSNVSGDGKLAISPDRFLIRAQMPLPQPTRYQEWPLSD